MEKREPMKREVVIDAKAIQQDSLAWAHSGDMETGAVVRFLGVVRAKEGGAAIEALEYEAFRAMAYHQFHLILNEVEARWPVQEVQVVHRIGVVPVGQPSLWVEVASAHRGEAFAACQYLIDEMKVRVPIWKKPVERICF